MKVRLNFVYGVLPAIIVYTKRGLGDFAGKACGILIRIDPMYKDDFGLLQHELTHVKQFYRTLGLHCIFYKYSKKYRFKSECEAYRVQVKYTTIPNSIDHFARFITKYYKLNVPVIFARRCLLKR